MGGLAGVTKVSQINYEKSKRSPDLDYLAALAAHGVDALYVVTGHRQITADRPPIDVSVLRSVIEAVETFLKRGRLSLANEKKADLMVIMYQHALAAGSLTAETTRQFLRLVA